VAGGYSQPYWDAPPVTPGTPQQELEALQAQAQAMEGDLQSIRQRIAELESEAGKEKKSK
jgi:prefoldin subunit 5